MLYNIPQILIRSLLILISLISAIIIYYICLRLTFKIFSRTNTWQQWSNVLKPFEGILKRNSCNFVEVAKSRTFFSKADLFSPLNFKGIDYPYPMYIHFDSESVDIKFHSCYYYPSFFESLLKLGNVNCYIFKVNLLFKLSNDRCIHCTLSSRENRGFQFHSLNVVPSEIEEIQFSTSQEMFDYIEEQLTLDLFS